MWNAVYLEYSCSKCHQKYIIIDVSLFLWCLRISMLLRTMHHSLTIEPVLVFTLRSVPRLSRMWAGNYVGIFIPAITQTRDTEPRGRERGRSPPRLSRAHCPLSRVPACPRRHIHTRPPHAAQPAWIFYTWPDLGWETGRRLEIERVLENKALNNWLGQFLGQWSGAPTNKV